MVLHAAPMNLQRASLFFSFALLTSLATSAAGCAAETSSDPNGAADGSEEVAASEDAITGAASNFGYYVVTRRDFRKCVSPLCGGFFVKRVNQTTTVCADGASQAECYVSSITFNGIGLSAREADEFRANLEAGKALVKARSYKTKFNGTTLGTLKASEAWVGATGSAPDGTFYRTADNGIRCITAPCPSTTAYALNAGDDHNVIDVRLGNTATPADQATIDLAKQAIGTKDGILIAGGIALPKCKPGSNCGPLAIASELYLRVTRREGKGCGSWSNLGCNAGQYCNWKPADICGAADAAGTCAYKPEFCPDIFSPVCGCDGKTYPNACNANSAGTSVSSASACPTP
ncbi:MAG: hypothetical protein JWO86_2820 [Myxococcaceae bacterium]|nr:hypothetical protein [Myxococcaceae bacterium]